MCGGRKDVPFESGVHDKFIKCIKKHLKNEKNMGPRISELAG